MQKNHFKGMKKVVSQVRFKKYKVQENNVIDNYDISRKKDTKFRKKRKLVNQNVR